MLKKVLLIVAISLMSLSLTGCKDGPDGKVFITFDWGITPSYWDDNPSVPKPITSNTLYESADGTYSYNYGGPGTLCSTYWYGTYTISSNSGEAGVIPFVEGDAGADATFDAYLGCFFGPTYIEYAEQGTGKKPGVVGQDNVPGVAGEALPTEGSPLVIEQVRGNKKMTIKAWAK